MDELEELMRLRAIKDPDQFKKEAALWLLRDTEWDKAVITISKESMLSMISSSISVGMARQDYFHSVAGK